MLHWIIDSAVAWNLWRFEFVGKRVLNHLLGEGHLHSRKKLAYYRRFLFFFLFHGSHLHLQLRQRFIHLTLLGGGWRVLGLFTSLGVNPCVSLYATVVILLMTLAFFFVASIT